MTITNSPLFFAIVSQSHYVCTQLQGYYDGYFIIVGIYRNTQHLGHLFCLISEIFTDLLNETGKEHAGITFSMVYSLLPSTQVIRVHINVDVEVYFTADCFCCHGAQIVVGFEPPLSAGCTNHQHAPSTLAAWFLAVGHHTFLVTCQVYQFIHL